MKSSYKKWTTFLMLATLLAASVVGFMIKLPSAFRHIDKELHSLFYFIAAAFLNILFVKRNLAKHLLVFGVLYFFGVFIEHAQSYSNQFFHKRIHGRYDPEDVAANLKGLVAFSVIWLIYIFSSLLYQKVNLKEVANEKS